jgi:hypothetical protein
MRFKLTVTLDVLIDVYVTLFLYACSEQTSMLGTCGDVCIRWNNLVVCIEE